MPSNVQKIRLLGSSFSLKVDEDPVYFSQLIKFIEEKFSGIQKEMSVQDPLRVAILSCILITDELFKEKDKKKNSLSDKEAAEVERMTLEIIKLIDSTL